MMFNTESQVTELPRDNSQKSLAKQLLSSVVINLVSFLQGASVSTSSIILHSLQKSDSIGDSVNNVNTTKSDNLDSINWFENFSISEDDGSWIASSWVLGHLISACFAGFLNDAIGRKKSLLIDTAVFFLGFILLATCRSASCLSVARFILGYPLVSQVYVCEIMIPSRRGLGAAIYSLLHSFGFFIILILGAFLPWRWAVSVPAFLSVPIFVAICFLHESPEWLNKMGQEKRCQEALRFYKKDLEGAGSKLVIKTFNENKTESKQPIVILVEKLKTFLSLLMLQDPSIISNMLYLAGLFLSIGWCGFSILSFYAVEIFQLSGSPFSASNTSWITASTKIGCSLVAFYVLHKYNRKTLFLITGSLVFMAFLLMGIFTFLSSASFISSSITSSLNFLPMVCVIIAYAGYGMGYNVIPNLLAAELIPVEIRSTFVGVLMTLEMTSTFILSKLKPVLLDCLGIHGLFLMFAGTVLFVIILTVIAMPKRKLIL